MPNFSLRLGRISLCMGYCILYVYLRLAASAFNLALARDFVSSKSVFALATSAFMSAFAWTLHSLYVFSSPQSASTNPVGDISGDQL
jgi:hypothetical protein